jgi:hypothetical protein
MELRVSPKPRPIGLALIGLLALVQASLGVMRALDWYHAGVDLIHHGIIILPVAGTVAMMRGGLIGAIALLYVVFALGAFTGRLWAWWLGLCVALINFLLVFSIVGQAEDVPLVLPWAIIPVIMIAYLVSRTGRAAFRHDRPQSHALMT